MCELFAQSFQKPVKPGDEMKFFLERSIYNPDGCGLCYAHPDRSLSVHKQPKMALKSPLMEKLMKSEELSSELFLLHVRLASPGTDICYENTHPFYFKLNTQDWVFMHNGTLQGRSRQLPLGQFQPKGQTDSSFSFAYILQQISENITKWSNESFEWLHNLLIGINKLGSFNIIMSNGSLLFCYTDKNLHNNGLGYFRKTKPGNSGFIISTNPLNDEEFERFQPCSLSVFKKGEFIFKTGGKAE